MSEFDTYIKQFIHDNQINIGEDDWLDINMHYDKDDILNAIKNEILNGNIELPLKRLTIGDAEESFNDLIDYKCKGVQYGKLTTRYDYSFELIGEGNYLDESNVGNVASDYFQQYNRFICDSINAPSPVRVWKNDRFLTGMLKALWSLKMKNVNDNAFRTCLALRKYVASQFKPAIAKSIYEMFDSKDVLDFSAGWGDRLCGFYSCQNTKSYIGIDPNKNTFGKYDEQSNFYSEIIGNKDTYFICEPAEDVILPREIVDTVFTSPPYFNIERYSQDSTQSFKRYKKLDGWLEGFLFRAIYNSFVALRPNGHLIINISDVYSGHTINNICDPMNRYIQSLGMEYEGIIGMRMAKRPNSRTIKDGIFIEPMWVWRKV